MPSGSGLRGISARCGVASRGSAEQPGFRSVGPGHPPCVTDGEQADGSNYRDDDESVDESAAGANYREDADEGDEPADGSNYRVTDDPGAADADGENYRPDRER